MNRDVLKNRLNDMAAKVYCLREMNTSLGLDFTMEGQQASNDQIQAALFEHRRASGLSWIKSLA